MMTQYFRDLVGENKKVNDVNRGVQKYNDRLRGSSVFWLQLQNPETLVQPTIAESKVRGLLCF